MEYDEIVLKMTGQLSEEMAIELFESKWWEPIGLAKAAWLQLHQERLCMPFGEYHKAVSFLLGRAVYNHELANSEALIAEVHSGKSPTLQEIMDLLPQRKLMVISSQRALWTAMEDEELIRTALAKLESGKRVDS